MPCPGCAFRANSPARPLPPPILCVSLARTGAGNGIPDRGLHHFLLSKLIQKPEDKMQVTLLREDIFVGLVREDAA